MIREAHVSDAAAIAEIYNYYILNTIITFELDPITSIDIAKRMVTYKRIGPYLVYEEHGQVIGYAYTSKFRDRKAYDSSVESTIYLRNGSEGKGIGYKLYSELLSLLLPKYHVIIGGISLPNEASVKLHEKCGFTKVGHFPEVGNKFGKWVDVGFWRRSGTV
ncbi:MAG: N-acetyltransferase family protein [Bacteroidota bacterium]|nr:N-acetyltransferase family protein [Bacteroidota bacterium]